MICKAWVNADERSALPLPVHGSVIHKPLCCCCRLSNKFQTGVSLQGATRLEASGCNEPNGLMQPQNNDTKLNASISHDKRDKAARAVKHVRASHNACRLSRWLLALMLLCMCPHYLPSFSQPSLARCSSSIFISQGAKRSPMCVLRERLSEEEEEEEEDMGFREGAIVCDCSRGASQPAWSHLRGWPSLILSQSASFPLLFSSCAEIKRSTRLVCKMLSAAL